jgi:hypothetical protein
MKKISTLIVLVIFAVLSVAAQDVQSNLDAARSAYNAESQLAARDNLQQALIELNNLIGKEILNIMPSALANLAANTQEDNIIGGTGFVGLLVGRTYGEENIKHIEVTLANESPMLAAVNSFLSNDMLSGLMASQTGQKQVTINGYKGMLEKSDDDRANSTFTINVPLGDSLFTFETTGFDSETDVVVLAQQIKLDEIVALLK